MAGGESYSIFEKTVSVNTRIATVYRHLRRIGGVHGYQRAAVETYTFLCHLLRLHD